jgi:hypothetical protein
MHAAPPPLVLIVTLDGGDSSGPPALIATVPTPRRRLSSRGLRDKMIRCEREILLK